MGHPPRSPQCKSARARARSHGTSEAALPVLVFLGLVEDPDYEPACCCGRCDPRGRRRRLDVGHVARARARCGNGGAHRAAEGGRARKATPAREAGGGRRRMRISAEARPATRPTRERRAVRLHACNDMRLGLQEWLIWYARRSCHGRRAPWAPHRPNASICKTTERRRDLCRR